MLCRCIYNFIYISGINYSVVVNNNSISFNTNFITIVVCCYFFYDQKKKAPIMHESDHLLETIRNRFF